MVASAAFAAATTTNFGLGRHTTLLQGLADVAVDHLGNAAEDVLCFDEGSDQRVGITAVLQVGETAHLDGRGLLSFMLFLMQTTAQRGQLPVERDGVLVREECFSLLARGKHIAVGDDGLAEFLNSLFDRAGFGDGCFHWGRESNPGIRLCP